MINAIIIKYFGHIFLLLGSLLIIRRKKIERVLLSFVLPKLYFISNSLCKIVFREKSEKYPVESYLCLSK